MKALFLLCSPLLIISSPFAQTIINSSNKTVTEYYFADQVEEIKGPEECYIISYTPIHSNKTLTKRDDKHLGVFYYVTGKDCRTVFDEKFDAMKSLSGIDDEVYSFSGSANIDPDDFSKINTIIKHSTIASGETHLYLIWLFGDNHTTDPRDDVFLGIDYVIDSADPDEINTSFDLRDFKDDLAGYPELKELIENNSYYQLREMIVNENLIVEKLRSDHDLRQITASVK